MQRLERLLVLPFILLVTQCAREEPKPAPPEPAQKAGTTAPSAADDVGAPAVRVPIDGLPVYGDERALVTIVAFVDYECPYSARADSRMATLRKEYGDRVRFVVASHPLPIHERARTAARAFLAAQEQGKGEAMHAFLFAHPDARDDEGLRSAAETVGLDVAAFEASRRGEKTESALRHAETLAGTVGADGTPIFFVNGRRLVGARPVEAFRALVDEELAKARALVESGTPAEKVYAKILASSPNAEPARLDRADEIVNVGVEDAPVRGAARAPVDESCSSRTTSVPIAFAPSGPCASSSEANPDRVRVAFRHRPLPMHAHARLAAKAAIAAERQGRFWQYHDVLVAHRDALEREDLERHAHEAGLDVRRFARDLDDPAVEARLSADEKRGEALGVKGTPTAFVNGRRVNGAQPLSTWLAAADRATR